MRRRDAKAALYDLLQAAALIAQFISTKTYEEYCSDRMLSSAVERQLEVVGEAMNRACRDQPSIEELVPDVRRVIAFRNILAHGYDVISTAVVWDIAVNHLPTLAAAVEELLEASSAPKEGQNAE